MPFEFIQIPANGYGSAKEELNKLLRGRRDGWRVKRPRKKPLVLEVVAEARPTALSLDYHRSWQVDGDQWILAPSQSHSQATCRRSEVETLRQ